VSNRTSELPRARVDPLLHPSKFPFAGSLWLMPGGACRLVFGAQASLVNQMVQMLTSLLSGVKRLVLEEWQGSAWSYGSTGRWKDSCSRTGLYDGSSPQPLARVASLISFNSTISPEFESSSVVLSVIPFSSLCYSFLIGPSRLATPSYRLRLLSLLPLSNTTPSDTFSVTARQS
jgi:hypothetical protein